MAKKWNLHDLLEVESAVINAEAKLRKAIAAANKAAPAPPCNSACHAIHGNVSDCKGTMRVNIEVLKRRIKTIEEAL